MAEKKKYNSILVSGRKDQTLTYSKYVKDEESGESVKESLDKKVNATDELTTQQIKDGAITNKKMAADSVGNSNIQNGSVSNEKLKDGSITNEKLAENSITKDKLKDNTIGVEKLDPELRQTINAATGLPEDLVETIQNVDDTLKDHQSQLDDKQSQIDDKQQQITANDEDISLLQTRSTQMEETIKGIAATGGASQATAVTYDNEKSGLTAVNAQSAIDETNTKLGDLADNTEIRNEDGATIKTPFREIESPEFLHCIVDAEDHFLFGIQLDGSIEWGKGIPAPIRAKLQEIISNCQQDKTVLTEAINNAKEELTSSLQAYQQTTDASIAALQEGKVDKEKGKSLIEDEVKECFKVIENEEFIKAIVDSEDKVLFGFRRDTGKPYYPLNEMYHVEQNEEFFALWLDTANHVLLGIRRDGEIIGEIHAVNALKQVIYQLQSDLATLQEKIGTIDTNLKELLDVFSLQENPEYLAVEQDAEGKVLSATNPDGSHYAYNMKSETIPTEFSHIEDPEGRMEITTDAEGKVVGFRDSEGTRHEKNLHVEELSLNNFNASEQAVDKFNSIIKKPWKTTDWSNETDIHLPLPKFAIFNVICSQELSKIDRKVGMEGFVKGWNCEVPAKIQFSDLSGNYFEKDIIFSAQGSSSMNFKIKNHAIDFADGSSIKFGDWIPMDSFHVKKYFIDVFRGQCVVAYHLAEQIMQTRSWSERRGFSYLDSSSETNGDSLPSNDFNTEALCHPDGFPVEMYYNGEYVGLYAWTLKKHRSNYNMKKGENTKIIIDGVSSTLWTGSVAWKHFELKNPKKLYYTDYDSLDETDTVIGSKKYLSAKHAIDKGYITKYKEVNGKKYYEYDGDYADEICGEESVDKGVSKAIKDYILNLHNFSKTSKDEFAKAFNVPLWIDYLLFSQFVYNKDGIGNNVVLTSYDLQKLCPNYYDLDCVFGSEWVGHYFANSESEDIVIPSENPMSVLKTLYADELKERYHTLRNNGIFSSSNVVKLYEEWVRAVGYDRLLKEINKMSELGVDIPSHSSTFCNSIGRIEKWVNKKLSSLDTLYNYK